MITGDALIRGLEEQARVAQEHGGAYSHAALYDIDEKGLRAAATTYSELMIWTVVGDSPRVRAALGVAFTQGVITGVQVARQQREGLL